MCKASYNLHRLSLLTFHLLSFIILPDGEVLELADRRDLGSRAERRKGSSPFFLIFSSKKPELRIVALKIETQTREDHQVQLVTELETEELENYKRRAARQIAKQSKIPGFRPGKAPYEVIKRYFGEDTIQKQAIELMVDDVYPKALKEANIDPAGPGQLEEIISVDPPKLSFIVPLAPEVALNDYQAMRKDYELPLVSDEDVDKVIQNLQRNFATAEPAERPAEKGDLVYMKISGDLTTPEDGDDSHFIQETPLQVVAGEESPETGNWPYEGFSDEVIGLSVDDEKQVQYTYPEDSPYERLRGKAVTFNVTVQSVKSLILPELDDEFAKTMGEFDTFIDLTNTVRKQLEENNLREYDDKYLSELIDEIVKHSTIKYPPHFLDHEIQHMLETLEQDLAQQRMDLETYLKTRQLDREMFVEQEVKPAAKRRLERSLLLEELAKAEKIRVENEELQSAVVQRMMEMQGQGTIDFSKFKSTAARQELTSNIAMDTASRLMNQHTLMRLKAIASGQAEAEIEEETVTEIEPVREEVAENTTQDAVIDETDKVTNQETTVEITLEPPAEAETLADEVSDTADDADTEPKVD
jgi:trigger factor